MIPFTPLRDRILVQPLEEQQSSIIITPDNAKKRSQRGRVVAVGDGYLAPNTGLVIPLDVKVGDVVIFGKFAGSEIPIMNFDGQELMVMSEGEVLAVVEG